MFLSFLHNRNLSLCPSDQDTQHTNTHSSIHSFIIFLHGQFRIIFLLAPRHGQEGAHHRCIARHWPCIEPSICQRRCPPSLAGSEPGRPPKSCERMPSFGGSVRRNISRRLDRYGRHRPSYPQGYSEISTIRCGHFECWKIARVLL